MTKLFQRLIWRNDDSQIEQEEISSQQNGRTHTEIK